MSVQSSIPYPDRHPQRDAGSSEVANDTWAQQHSDEADGPPALLIERGWIEQAVHAQSERQRCLRLLAVMRAQTARTAQIQWEQNQEDEVTRFERMFNVDRYAARVGLMRSAAGCRHLISTWERLEARLAQDGTWYGIDRIEAIQLQGFSARVEDLYFSEPAYLTWLHCLAAQPNPKKRDIDLIMGPGVVPKALQDKDVKLWRPDPAYCREQLQALVTRELPPLRIREQRLRTLYEDPARAAAEPLAQVEACQAEAPLLRAIQAQERSFRQAANALVKHRNATAAAAREIDATLVNAPTIDRASLAPGSISQEGQASRGSGIAWLRGLRILQGMRTRKRHDSSALFEAEAIIAPRTEPKPEAVESPKEPKEVTWVGARTEPNPVSSASYAVTTLCGTSGRGGFSVNHR